MKIKSFLISALVVILFSGSALANTTTKGNTDLASKIKTALAKYNLDQTNLDGETLKIRFIINEKSEIIVLSTNNKQLDNTIKHALNYDKIDQEDLVPFEIYIVPVTFKAK